MRHLFYTVLLVEMSKSKRLADLIFSDGCLIDGWLLTKFLNDEESKLWCIFYYKGTNSILGALPSGLHLDFITSQKLNVS